MPKYILNYFPTGGRAVAARVMFQFAGVEFTDNHILFAEWQTMKEDGVRFPLHQMPTLQVDDKVICQSAAIYRYLANELGFYGANNEERAAIDQITETFFEYFAEVWKVMFLKKTTDEVKRAKYAEIYASESTKTKFNFITKFLKDNNDGKSFLVGDKISYADILLFQQDEMIGIVFPSYIDPYPELQQLLERINDTDIIKNYRETRKY